MPRVQLSRPDQPPALRWPLKVYEGLASLRLAVVLIALFVLLLAWATVVETWYGGAGVRFGIYGSWWFGALGSLLGLNILCAALIRLPWKKQQTGFVMTHAGLLILLMGCLLTRLGGIDAQLPVLEGHANWRAYSDSQHFRLAVQPAATTGRPEAGSSVTGNGSAGAGETIIIPFASGPFNWDELRTWSLWPGELGFWFPWKLARRDEGVVYDQGGIRLEVLDYHADSKAVDAPRVTLRVTRRSAGSTTGLLNEQGESVSLSVHSMPASHGQGPSGMPGRQRLPDGTQMVFWMAGTAAATEAFRDSRPEGDLGKQGQLVVHAGGKKFTLPVDSLQKRKRVPLGDTGLELEFTAMEEPFGVVRLLVHGAAGEPESLAAFAGLPDFNRHDLRHGVFVSYWKGGGEAPKQDQAGARSAVNPGVRRIDIIQGADQKLYYRTWQSPRVETIALLPLDGSVVTAFPEDDEPVTVRVEDFMPRPTPGVIRLPVPYDARKNWAEKQRQARVRLTVDGKTEEFWLAGLQADLLDTQDEARPPSGEDQQYLLRGHDRQVTITMPRDETDIGFQVFLRQFQRRLDPGTSQASYYASLVDLCDRRDPRKVLEQEVLITLNAPVNFSDPKTKRSYRLFQHSYAGPWKPGDPIFEHKTSGHRPSDQLFLSWLTVNYDPGRGLKYAGSLLVIVGISVVFYMKAYFFRHRRQEERTY